MRRLVLPGAVAVALLAVYLIAQMTQPGPARIAVQGGQSAAVASVNRSSPPVAGTTAGRITMIALPPGATAGGAASAQGTAPAGDARLRAVVAAPAASGGATSGPAANSGKTANQHVEQRAIGQSERSETSDTEKGARGLTRR